MGRNKSFFRSTHESSQEETKGLTPPLVLPFNNAPYDCKHPISLFSRQTAQQLVRVVVKEFKLKDSLEKLVVLPSKDEVIVLRELIIIRYFRLFLNQLCMEVPRHNVKTKILAALFDREMVNSARRLAEQSVQVPEETVLSDTEPESPKSDESNESQQRLTPDPPRSQSRLSARSNLSRTKRYGKKVSFNAGHHMRRFFSSFRRSKPSSVKHSLLQQSDSANSGNVTTPTTSTADNALPIVSVSAPRRSTSPCPSIEPFKIGLDKPRTDDIVKRDTVVQFKVALLTEDILPSKPLRSRSISPLPAFRRSLQLLTGGPADEPYPGSNQMRKSLPAGVIASGLSPRGAKSSGSKNKPELLPHEWSDCRCRLVQRYDQLHAIAIYYPPTATRPRIHIMARQILHIRSLGEMDDGYEVFTIRSEVDYDVAIRTANRLDWMDLIQEAIDLDNRGWTPRVGPQLLQSPVPPAEVLGQVPSRFLARFGGGSSRSVVAESRGPSRTSLQTPPGSRSGAESPHTQVLSDRDPIESGPLFSLYPWFHESLGEERANRLVTCRGAKGHGTFLVRQSGSDPG